MQLFGSGKKDSKVSLNSNKEFIEGRISTYRVAILSSRKDLVDNIRTVLFLYNILSIEVFIIDFDDIKENPSWVDFDVFIIDIGPKKEAEQISLLINRFIPIKSTSILVGSHDSITFSELLVQKGIHFLLEDRQLENIPDILYRRSYTPPGSSKRVGSIVSFLGCKGGIGTSSLIMHVLKNISKATNYPLSYVQSSLTSQNADFLFEVPIAKDGTFIQINDSIHVKLELDDQRWNYDYLDSGSFNISVLDHNISLDMVRSHLNLVVNISNIIFLVINRDPFTIKVAKDILEEISRIGMKDNQILNKRFLICLNESYPFDKNASLQNVDIEEYLGRKIDFVRKFINSEDKFKKAYNSSEINAIAQTVIGKHDSSADKSKKLKLLFSKKSKSK